MHNREMPTPSPAEIRDILSLRGPEGSVAEELVYTALGMYNETDYVGLAQITVDLGGFVELAAAEAKLQVIEDNDNRKPGYSGFKYDAHLNQQRSSGVDLIVQSLDPDVQNAFFEEYEYESAALQAEQEKAA